MFGKRNPFFRCCLFGNAESGSGCPHDGDDSHQGDNVMHWIDKSLWMAVLKVVAVTVYRQFSG